MSIFGSILSKLGIGNKSADADAATADAAPAAAAAGMSDVDVVAKLDGMGGSGDLNWKTSIVDMLKLLDIDSSFNARKTLATEVGIAGYEGTAEQNGELHKAVMQKLAANGGTLPASMTA